MVLFHLAAMAKLPLIQLFQLSPLLWPFNLYLPLLRHLPRVCSTVVSASTLFAFRVRQILVVDRLGRTRWERTARLIGEELMPWRFRPRYSNARVEEAIMESFFILSY